MCLSAWPCLGYGGICNDARKQKCIIMLYIFLKIEFNLRKNFDLKNKIFWNKIFYQKSCRYFCLHSTSMIGNFKYSYNLFFCNYTYFSWSQTTTYCKRFIDWKRVRWLSYILKVVLTTLQMSNVFHSRNTFIRVSKLFCSYLYLA